MKSYFNNKIYYRGDVLKLSKMGLTIGFDSFTRPVISSDGSLFPEDTFNINLLSFNPDISSLEVSIEDLIIEIIKYYFKNNLKVKERDFPI